MASLAPLGPVYQAGTLSGNPLATAAGLAVLDFLDDAFFDVLAARATRLAQGLFTALAGAGIAAQVPAVGSLVGLHLAPEPAIDYESASRTDEKAYARLFHALLDRGVAIAPGAYEVLFPGLAHTDDVIDEVLAIAGQAAAELR
jgi:glutamate-1-semialdehyde 2,1-aminomutase